MQYVLQVLAGPDAGLVLPLEDGHLALVGRSRSCDLQLRDPRVSRIHFRILVAGASATISDAGSLWGMEVNGEHVERATMQAGDAVVVGATRLRFDAMASPIAATLPPPPAAAPIVKAAPPPKAATPAAVPLSPADPSKRHTGEKQPRGLRELVGQKLSRYHLEWFIASGRTGTVFRARDTQKDRVVALKVLWPELSAREAEVQRFVRAMKTMGPLRHPQLVNLHAAGISGGHCWMAYEYVDGHSLTELIQRVGVAGMLDWKQVLQIALDISRALEFAHEHKIVHRNITPRNILVSKDGRAKLGDLMLAKALEGTLAEAITQPGEIVGELAYLSPEQTRGDGLIDHRSDIYSLGATLYTVLMGRPPFAARSAKALIEKIQDEVPESPKTQHLGISPLFEDTVLKMLAKRPEGRFESATKLIRHLERVEQLRVLG